MGSDKGPSGDPCFNPRLERLFQAVGIYVYTVCYENGSVVETNHSIGCQAVTGYAQEEYDHEPGLWLSMVHPEDRAQVLQQVIAAEHSEKATKIEHRIIHRNGSVRWVENTIIPNFNCGRLVCCDGLIEDVTNRKRAERSLTHQTKQLTAAQEIQRRLLPQMIPKISGLEIAGGLIPAEYAAGDFYDYVTMQDGSPAFVIGDVSGHGFGSALLMSLTHTLVRVFTEIEDNIAIIFALVNDFLVRETQDDRFVTLFFARYDVETRTITYTSAGHPPAYVVDKKGRLKARLTSTSLPLGVLSDATFTCNGHVCLERQDVMMMLTDGILETPGPDNEFFGEARTVELLQKHRNLSPRELFETFRRRLSEFSHQAILSDDVTAVILKVH